MEDCSTLTPTQKASFGLYERKARGVQFKGELVQDVKNYIKENDIKGKAKKLILERLQSKLLEDFAENLHLGDIVYVNEEQEGDSDSDSELHTTLQDFYGDQDDYYYSDED